MIFDDLVTKDEYAAARGITIRTAQRERSLRIGPPFIRLGKRIFYRKSVLADWVLAQEKTQPRSRALMTAE